MFIDRKDAGQKLAAELQDYQPEKPVVFAIPRGGVIVAAQVAESLNTKLSVLVSRKLPYPFNPESGFGALAEDGSLFVFKDAEKWLSKLQIEQIIADQNTVLNKRIDSLRGGKPLPDMVDKTVILVDDGIATGSTMIASIKCCKNKNAKKIVVAAPVAGPRVADEITALVDDIVVLESPPNFRAVAQVYQTWRDITDDEAYLVLERFNGWKKKPSKNS